MLYPSSANSPFGKVVLLKSPDLLYDHPPGIEVPYGMAAVEPDGSLVPII
jgi:hypothetical protein